MSTILYAFLYDTVVDQFIDFNTIGRCLSPFRLDLVDGRPIET